MLKKIWKTVASVKTTFWLMSLVILFFIIGSVYFRVEKKILFQLNFKLFQDWIKSDGLTNLSLSWWFFCLLFLLFLLGINTFACVVDRLSQLMPLKKTKKPFEFSVMIMPSIIHLVFLLVLAGHLLSSICGSVETAECAPGQTIQLSEGKTLRVLETDFITYQKPEILKDKLRGATATLAGETTEGPKKLFLKISAPVFFEGYVFFLDSFDKYAREKKMRLIIRRDLGIKIIIPGLFIIIALMAWYFPALRRFKIQNGVKQ